MIWRTTSSRRKPGSGRFEVKKPISGNGRDRIEDDGYHEPSYIQDIIDRSKDSQPYEPSPSSQRISRRTQNQEVDISPGKNQEKRRHFDKSYESLMNSKSPALSQTAAGYTRDSLSTKGPQRATLSAPLNDAPEWKSEQALSDATFPSEDPASAWGSSSSIGKTGHSRSQTTLFKSPLPTRINYGSNLCMINDEITESFSASSKKLEVQDPTEAAPKSKPTFDSLDEVFAAFCKGMRRQSQISLFENDNYHMDGRTFQKFARDCNLIDANLTATSVDLVFTKSKSVGSNKLSIIQFYTAVKRLGELRWPNHSPNDSFGLIYTFITHSSGPKMNTKVKSTNERAQKTTNRLSTSSKKPPTDFLDIRRRSQG